MLIRLHKRNLIKDNSFSLPFLRHFFLLGANFGNKLAIKCPSRVCIGEHINLQFNSTHSIKAFGLENVSVYSIQLPPSPGAAPVNAAILHLIIHLLLRLRNVNGRIGKDGCVSRLDFVFRVHAAEVRWSRHGDRNRNWHAIIVRGVGIVSAVDDTRSIASAVHAAPMHTSAVHTSTVHTSAVHTSTMYARMPNRSGGTRLGAGAATRDASRTRARSASD